MGRQHQEQGGEQDKKVLGYAGKEDRRDRGERGEGGIILGQEDVFLTDIIVNIGGHIHIIYS